MIRQFTSRGAFGLFTFAPLLVLAGACGDDGSVDANPDAMVEPAPLLEPPPEGEGYQFTMNTTIAAGAEAEHCVFVTGPAVEFFINRDEVRFTQGSHHFLLYETPYTAIPTMKEDGTPVDTSGVFDCSDGPTDGWRITKLIGGSQNGTGDSIARFPPGVAMSVASNRVLLMNAHYLNASDAEITPEVRINLWTIPEAEVTELGDILFIYNPIIRASAMKSEKAQWRCPVHTDITLVNVQSHMHARGLDYAVGLLGEAPFYTNDKWESVPVGRFDPGIEIPAGSTLEYYCEYMNDSTETIYQGPRSTDEMCMVIGSYYPADGRTANCLNAAGNGFGGDWVGQGTATCNATVSCLFGAFSGADVLRRITDCVQDSDPAVAAPMSLALTCVLGSSDPLNECETEIAACQAL